MNSQTYMDIRTRRFRAITSSTAKPDTFFWQLEGKCPYSGRLFFISAGYVKSENGKCDKQSLLKIARHEAHKFCDAREALAAHKAETA